MRGVVIEIDEQGTHGKIISLRQPDNKLPWAYGNACQSLVGADNRADGMINMSHIRTIDDWEQQYPAFAWCASLGDNWYLPAIDELSALLANQTLINSINKTLEELLAPQIHTHGSWNDFWSSTESPTVYIPDEEYEAELTTNAYGFFFFDNKEHEVSKGGDLGVRAFAKF